MVAVTATAAITPDDLDGFTAGHIAMGNEAQYAIGTDCYNGELKVIDGELYLTGLLGSFDVPVTLTTEGYYTYFTITPGTFRGHGGKYDGKAMTLRALEYLTCFQTDPANNPGIFWHGYDLKDGGNADLTGRISYSELSQAYYADLRDLPFLLDFDGDADDEIIGGLYIIAYDPNGTAIEYVGGKAVRSYPVHRRVSGSTLELSNWNDCGAAYTVNYDSSAGYLVTKISFPEGIISGSDMSASITARPIRAAVPYTYCGRSTAIVAQTPYTCYWVQNAPTDDITYYYIGADTAGSDIIGTWQNISAIHAGYDFDPWVTNNGSVNTITRGNRIDFGSSLCYDSKGNIINSADATAIIAGTEETLNVGLTLVDVSSSDADGVTVTATIKPKANTSKVEKYELYMAPGKLSSVKAADFVVDYDKGHAKAQILGDNYNTSVVAGNAGEVTYTKHIATADIVNRDADGQYTFFVKATYTAASGLQPTFHSLAYIDLTPEPDPEPQPDPDPQPDPEGSVSDITADQSAAAREIYSLQGRLMPRGAALLPGIYIVKSGSSVSKTIIR
ncbi:MAG: hypothetical protein ACI30K_04820 [Muribaculaceae bacterium]